MMASPQRVCNGLARPAHRADESMLAWDIGTETGHSEDIIVSAAHSPRRRKIHAN